MKKKRDNGIEKVETANTNCSFKFGCSRQQRNGTLAGKVRCWSGNLYFNIGDTLYCWG